MIKSNKNLINKNVVVTATRENYVRQLQLIGLAHVYRVCKTTNGEYISLVYFHLFSASKITAAHTFELNCSYQYHQNCELFANCLIGN